MSIEGSAIEGREAHTIARAAPPLIGPHAVIHLAAAINDRLSPLKAHAIFVGARMNDVPSGETMIPETDALRLHRCLALHEPIECFAIVRDAAERTAAYIIANRIPPAAIRLLAVMPRALSGALLMRAIRRHAWTFIGAGDFRPMGAWAFEIDRRAAHNAVALPDCLFHWYAKVFEDLYQRLVPGKSACMIERSSSTIPGYRKFRIARSD